MDRYIGTQIVLAEPKDEDEFMLEKKGEAPSWAAPPGGWRQGYRVVYEDGYVSWSPKETFERAYRKITPEEAGLIITGENPGRTQAG